MSDIAQLETEILSAVAAAGDEAALDAVRIGALGKSGSATACKRSIGKFSWSVCSSAILRDRLS